MRERMEVFPLPEAPIRRTLCRGLSVSNVVDPSFLAYF